MIDNHAAYKYETPNKVTFVITQCWTNRTVTLQYVGMKIRYNIRRTRPHTSDTKVEDINPEIIIEGVTLGKYLLYNSILH